MNLSIVLAPFVALFRNRTFVTFFVGAIVAVVVGLVPSLATYQEQIISVVVALVLLSAGGEIVQNAVQTNADAKVESLRIQLQIAQTQVAAKSDAASMLGNYIGTARG